MFSALACVTFAFSAFASNEVVIIKEITDSNFKPEGICEYTITLTYKGADGNYYSEDKTFVTNASSAEDCSKKANSHTQKLNNGLAKW